MMASPSLPRSNVGRRLMNYGLILLSAVVSVQVQQVAGQTRDLEGGSLAAVRDTMVIVRRGQNLSQVVMRHFLRSDYATAHEMLQWTRYHNRLSSDVLIAGQSLRIPLGPLEIEPQAAKRQDSTTGAGPVRGIYINVRQSGQGGAIDLARRLQEVGGNAVVFDIKDRDGMLIYNSRVDLANEIGASAKAVIDDPKAFIRRLQDRGLKVIARLVCFQDGHLAMARRDLVPRTASGMLWSQRPYGWVDPARPEVQVYLFELIEEAAALGVDEIQLDYVRFPTVGDVDEGVVVQVESGPSRSDVITDFVEQASAVCRALGVHLSADIFGVAAWAHAEDSQRTGQDVQRLLPHLDVVCPMLYPSHFSAGFGKIDDPSQRPFDLVYRGCVRLRDAAAFHEVRLRPWIQAFPWRVVGYSALYVAEQLRAAREGGASGWLLWNPANRYDEAMEAMQYFPGAPPQMGPQDGRDGAAEPLGSLYPVRSISPRL